MLSKRNASVVIAESWLDSWKSSGIFVLFFWFSRKRVYHWRPTCGYKSTSMWTHHRRCREFDLFCPSSSGSDPNSIKHRILWKRKLWKLCNQAVFFLWSVTCWSEVRALLLGDICTEKVFWLTSSRTDRNECSDSVLKNELSKLVCWSQKSAQCLSIFINCVQFWDRFIAGCCALVNVRQSKLGSGLLRAESFCLNWVRENVYPWLLSKSINHFGECTSI